MAMIGLVTGVSVWASIVSHDWTWFGRSGGATALLGGCLAARHIIRTGVRQAVYDSQHITFSDSDPTTPEELEAVRQTELDIRAGHLSFWFITIGTLIWAYGDLLGRWFAPAAS